MSTDPHKHSHDELRLPVHDDISFETKDVRVTAITKFLVYLGIGTLLSFVIALFVYRGLRTYWLDTYAPPPPSRETGKATMPPEPMLQGMPGHLMDPQQDWRNMVKEGHAANHELKWVNQQAGIAQIPVKDAMDLIVEKGLPVVPPLPAEKK